MKYIILIGILVLLVGCECIPNTRYEVYELNGDYVDTCDDYSVGWSIITFGNCDNHYELYMQGVSIVEINDTNCGVR